MKINSMAPGKHKYLQIISTIAKVPERLYINGTLPEERRPTVAIVGTRKPTHYGLEVTHQLAYELASRGVVVISGLAYGIDAAAHRAALEAGGTTIAVLPTDVSHIYPRANQQLAQQIIDNGGALISEYEPGAAVYKTNFLERNRIVSGLSDAVIVTEAAIRSGTLATVTHALEQGREVFVVPGNITSPLSAGCNNLIKQGAHPVTHVDDVLQIIAPHLLKASVKQALGNNPSETALIALLRSGIRDGDELLATTKLSASDYAQAMTMMEIEGVIRPLGGNQWALC